MPAQCPESIVCEYGLSHVSTGVSTRLVALSSFVVSCNGMYILKDAHRKGLLKFSFLRFRTLNMGHLYGTVIWDIYMGHFCALIEK